VPRTHAKNIRKVKLISAKVDKGAFFRLYNAKDNGSDNANNRNGSRKDKEDNKEGQKKNNVFQSFVKKLQNSVGSNKAASASTSTSTSASTSTSTPTQKTSAERFLNDFGVSTSPLTSPGSMPSLTQTQEPYKSLDCPDVIHCDWQMPELTTPRPLTPQELQIGLPSHDELVSGMLPNGLGYVILRNGSPAGRIEAHLEIFSGSADELEHEQGLAHVVEHVSYMGNAARERLLQECSAQTNAYTDFHHTVFYASTDVEPKNRSLKMALNALKEVLEAKVESRRLEQERAAVLSEMTMVNTIEYRTECALLAVLHQENRLAIRFPIGLEECIRSWTVEDVQAYHDRHYCPSNAFLYLVGDINETEAKALVESILGPVKRTRFPDSLDPDYKKVIQGTLKETQNRAFPPVVHSFVGDPKSVPREKSLSVFRHPLLHGFSLHVFAKRRIVPMRTIFDLKRILIQRIVSAALQIRFNVISRGSVSGSDDETGGVGEANVVTPTGSAFNFVEFVQMDSGREACNVSSLDMVSAREMWASAVRLAVVEMRRLGIHGLTPSELQRYMRAVFQDVSQVAAQADRVSNTELIQALMDSVASKSVFMHPNDMLYAVELILSTLTLEEVNKAAAEMCRHVMTEEDVFRSPLFSPNDTNMSPEGLRMQQKLFTSLIAACVPTSDDFEISDEQILEVYEKARREQIDSDEEVVVPVELLDLETKKLLVQNVQELEKRYSTLMVRTIGRFPSGIPNAPLLSQYSVCNGLKLNILPSTGQPGRAHLRMVAPGGRMAEDLNAIGSVAVGSRTLQEGGAFHPWSRQQVELFCVDNLIQVEVSASLEFMCVDIGFPVNLAPSALLLLNRILERKISLEKDAFLRAKQAFEQAAGEVDRSLEDSAVEHLLSQLSGGDRRLLSITSKDLSQLKLEDSRTAVEGHFTTDSCEITFAGDIGQADDVLSDIRMYLATIAPSSRDGSLKLHTKPGIPVPRAESSSLRNQKVHFQKIQLEDTDERAAAFVAGESISWWGYTRDGKNVGLVNDDSVDDATRRRRSHPLFSNAASAILQEVLNRRLFSALRETERLTYDAKFNILGSDRLYGAYYLAEVTASPSTVSKALQVMMRTLRAVQSGERRILEENVRNARRSVISRHNSELDKNAYLCELCMGMLLDCVPQKDARYLSELLTIAEDIKAVDLFHMLQYISLPSKECEESFGANCNESSDLKTVSCVAISSMGTTSKAKKEDVIAAEIIEPVIAPTRKPTALGH